MRSSPPTGDEVGWVLVVDDDPDDRADARQMLRTSGRRYEVVEAETGAAGVRAVLEAAGGPPDCVLLDYFLPDMDAPEVLAALAGPDKLPVCPVVVLTGADVEDLGRAVLRAGAQDYIGKDWLTPAGLVRAIENAAERWRMARELRDREEQLSLAFEAADLACFAWDVAADRVERRLSRLSSLPSTDGLGDGPTRFATVAAVVHPDDRVAFESAVRAALAGDGRYANRYRVPGADGGSPVWVEEHGRVWFDGGRPIRLVGVARDVTARQREAERRALLVDVARVVLEAPAADAALSERVFGMIRGSLGVDVLFNYQLAGDGSLRLMTEVGIPAEQTAAAERLELGQAFCGAAAAARRQLVADHGCISTDPRGAFLRDMGVRAYACHPLLARNGGLLGTFSVGSTTRDAFDPAEVEFLQTVCHFLALAWDRQRAEDAARRAEAFTRHVTDVAPSLLYVYDLDGRRNVWSNRETFALLGYTREQMDAMAGDLLGTLLHPDDLGPYQAHAGRLLALADGEAAEFEYRMRTLDGSWRWLISRDMVFARHADGRPRQIVGAALDVTARKEGEQRLAESESFYRQTLESIPGMVFTNTPDGACDYVSGPWVAFTGVPAADQLGRGWKQVLHPDDQDRVSAAWRAAVEGSGLYDVEYRVRRHDGVYEWFKARGRAIRDAAGAVVRWLGTAVNIDDLKQAEAALKARERELQTLADNSPDILIRFDRELRHVFANAAVEKASGLRRTDFLGRTNRELGMPPDVCDRWEAALRRVFAAGQPQFVEFDYQVPAGLRHYASRLVPEFGPDGQVEQVLGVIHDVTERKRFEQTLAEQDRRKDEFLATLAHELRNPLAPIRNGLEILRMAGEVSGTMAKARAMMERQVVHLVRLVDDLLDISRVSRGKIPLRMEAVTVREIVGAAIEACRPTVDAKRHALVVDLPDAPLVLDGDRTRLVQVLSNILTNAAKYSEDGGQIRVAARREGDDAVIQVTDTGVGIAPDMLPTLWDMFAQVRDTLDKAQGGLGIGLSLVKKLVEMHGGSVTAESPGVGHGSTFTVRLPLGVARATIPSVDPADRTPAGRPVGRRVLVVDDNVDGAESLAMMLDVFGHRAEVALTGPAALAAAGTFRPEVVLCDIGLPGMDGYEVARRLRADPSTADTVLVALTGWGSAEDKRRSKAAGFDFHLTKPVEAGAVQGLLARLR